MYKAIASARCPDPRLFKKVGVLILQPINLTLTEFVGWVERRNPTLTTV